MYPSYVAQRVASTYGYVVAGLGMTAGFAQYILRSGLYYRVASMNPMIMLVGTMAGTIGMLGLSREHSSGRAVCTQTFGMHSGRLA